MYCSLVAVYFLCSCIIKIKRYILLLWIPNKKFFNLIHPYFLGFDHVAHKFINIPLAISGFIEL